MHASDIQQVQLDIICDLNRSVVARFILVNKSEPVEVQSGYWLTSISSLGLCRRTGLAGGGWGWVGRRRAWRDRTTGRDGRKGRQARQAGGRGRTGSLEGRTPSGPGGQGGQVGRGEQWAVGRWAGVAGRHAVTRHVGQGGRAGWGMQAGRSGGQLDGKNW